MLFQTLKKLVRWFAETLPEDGPGTGAEFKTVKLDASGFAGLSDVHHCI